MYIGGSEKEEGAEMAAVWRGTDGRQSPGRLDRTQQINPGVFF